MTQTFPHDFQNYILKHCKKIGEGKSTKIVPPQTEKIKANYLTDSRNKKQCEKTMNCLNGIYNSFRINTYLKTLFSKKQECQTTGKK